MRQRGFRPIQDFFRKLFPVVLLLGGAVSSFASAADETADLRREVEQLRRREAALHSELDRLRVRFLEREKLWRRQEIWMSNLVDQSKITPVSEREERLLVGIRQLTKTGNELTLRSSALCGELRPLLDEIAIGAARRARLLLAMEQVEKSAGKFSVLTDLTAADNPMPRQCRILAVDGGTGTAVLSIGSLHGAVPGMLFRTPDGKCSLRVTAARPYISAAEPTDVSGSALAPGMSLRCFTPENQLKGLPGEGDSPSSR